MPKSKSPQKRARQSKAGYERNKAYRSGMRTAVRRVREAVTSGNREQAEKALAAAIPVISKTASKGIIHRNNAARKISRLTSHVAKLAAR